MIWQIGGGKSIKLDSIKVMGILNVTPDSFSDGNRYLTPEEAVAHAKEMVEQGADIIDIGGQSTRPGYSRITAQEEWSRIKHIVAALCAELRTPISIDTFYPEVAARSIKAGAHIINDVTGFDEPLMRQVAALSGAGCIVTHHNQLAEGLPAAPQIKEFFLRRLAELTAEGVKPECVCFDPGIGFGKTNAENLQALGDFRGLCVEEHPMLIAASRKRVIGTATGVSRPEERDFGTVTAHTAACMQGANIVRVHNVEAAVQAARLCDELVRYN